MHTTVTRCGYDLQAVLSSVWSFPASPRSLPAAAEFAAYKVLCAIPIVETMFKAHIDANTPLY